MISPITQQDRVLSLREIAEMSNISLATLRRQIKRGQGPTITKVGLRKRGVRLQHARAWLDERAEATTVSRET